MINPIGQIRSWRAARKHRAELRSLASGSGWVPAAPVLSGTFVTPETAIGLTAVYAAVNVISRDCAIMPRNVYRQLRGGGRLVDAGHPVHDLIRWQADDDLNALRFFQTILGHVLTRGNGYAEIERQDGVPVALHLLSPTRTRPKRTPGGVLYYELDGDDSRRLAPENVLHFAGLSFDGIRGYSPLTVARQTIGIGLGSEQTAAAFYGNSAVPKGLLKFPKTLKESALKNLRASWNAVHQGSQSAHQVAILEEGGEWVSTQIPPEDGQFLQTRQFQVQEIARLFSVPPSKIGDYSNSHLRNIEEANLDYIATTLHGWIAMMEYELNLKLLTPNERRRFSISFDMTALMRGDSASRVSYYTSMRNMGAISADEIRDMEGLNPIGPERGGDLYIVQGQYLPLEDTAKQPDATPGGPPVDQDPNDDGDDGRSLRFNPNHDDHTGEFSDGTGSGGGPEGGGGKGGSGSGPAITEADRAATNSLIDAARANGMDVAIGKGKPSDSKQAKALAKAGDAGKHAVTVTEMPKVETVTRGDVVTQRFGDPGLDSTWAKTYPDPNVPGRWISSQKSSQYAPDVKGFKTQAQATRASSQFIKGEQARLTDRKTVAVKAISDAVGATLDGYSGGIAAKSWKVRFKVLQ